MGWPLLFLLATSLASMTFPAHAASSDLTVESIWLEDALQIGQPVSQLSPGQSFIIVATIRNIGQDAASGYYLDVYYDSDYGRGGPDNIAPGEVQTWYVGPLTAQAGTHTTKWVVDPDNQIAELDEGNNQGESAFTIGSQTTTTTTTITTTPNSTSSSTAQTTTTTTTSSTTSSTLSSTTSSTSASTLSPATVSITVTASPVGSIVVDGTTYTSSQTFAWIPGSSHTIAANSPVSGAPGTQYVWASWADGGDQSRTVTAPSSLTTYTANYQTQYQVTFAANPSGGGAVTVDGQPSVTAWYDDGAVVSVQASWSPGYAFSSWSSDTASIVFADSSSPSMTVTIHGAGTVAANFLTVQDKTAPLVTVPVDITVEATGPTGAVVAFTASALDAVDGSLAPTCTPSSSSMFALGSTKVTCSVADKAGNTGSASFNVTVVDKTPPTLKIPADMTVQATSPGAVVTFSASASDLVDGSVPVTCTPASGSTFPVGTTTVACSATDKASNSASASFKVTVTSNSTVAVTVKLLSSNGNGLSGGVVKYYRGGWRSFGTTGSDGTVSMALTPGTYTFQISYGGASQQTSQNVGTNALVTFQTVQVHSDSGKCTSYYAGGWRTFTQDMELLPGTYTFRFSDRTRNTSYAIVVGSVKHIH